MEAPVYESSPRAIVANSLPLFVRQVKIGMVKIEVVFAVYYQYDSGLQRQSTICHRRSKAADRPTTFLGL